MNIRFETWETRAKTSWYFLSWCYTLYFSMKLYYSLLLVNESLSNWMKSFLKIVQFISTYHDNNNTSIIQIGNISYIQSMNINANKMNYISSNHTKKLRNMNDKIIWSYFPVNKNKPLHTILLFRLLIKIWRLSTLR